MILPKAGKKFDLETQLRAYWLHEFNDDEDKLDYTLIDSGLPGQFVLRSPDQDVGQFGIGLVAKYRNGLQLRADLDGLKLLSAKEGVGYQTLISSNLHKTVIGQFKIH